MNRLFGRRQQVLMCLLVAATMQVTAQQGSLYEKEINDWHGKRIASLRSPNGWLNLAALHWLKPGKTTFGSAPENDWVLKGETLPAKAGYFELVNNTVRWYTQEGVTVLTNNQPVTQQFIFHPDSLRAPELTVGSYRWTIIKREDKYGVRLRDLNSPAVQHFPGVERFPVDSNWRVTARLLPSVAASIAITNVLGQTSQQKAAGKLQFTLQNKTFTLDALEEGNQLFILFGDASNGETTYASGRFLYAAKPDASGKVVLDFNKAYNPPCAFTDFATCPLPPPQNNLPIAVTAGEKNYGTH